MDGLPQEVVDNICSHLDHDNLKSVLLLSRKFQYAAEQYSEAFDSYCLTIGSIDRFVETYTGRRFRYLRQLEFRTTLPPPDGIEGPEDAVEGGNTFRESQEELESIDENYTQQINLLFTAINTVETQECNTTISGNIHLKLFTPTMELNPTTWPLQRLFVSWRVHLLMPETLPVLNSIRALTIESPEQTWYSNGPEPSLRKLDLRVLLDLSDRLPNLSTLCCRVGADELYSNTFPSEALRYITQDWVGLRKDSFSTFVKSLEKISLRNLRHARLDFLYPQSHIQYIDQRMPMPELVDPSLCDPFSTSIRMFLQQLRTMDLRVIADTTLFWPGDGDTPHWPNLEHLHVEFHMSNPSGSWYFNEPTGLSLGGTEAGYRAAEAEMYPPLADTEQDDSLWEETCETDLEEAQTNFFQYRVVPNDAALVPFLTGFAKAAVHMPRLRTFALWSPLSFRLNPDDEEYQDFDFESVSNIPKHVLYAARLAWGIAYTGPYERAFSNDTETINGQRQMSWRTGSWRPQAGLHELFRKIGGGYVKDRSEWFDEKGLRDSLDFERFRYRYFDT
ncbi:hypothetical protein EKO04_002673 [Ascochyta lentis]|uniref:F-box domain-containing protein n=1 Tax=Ascochyta lentis TaxID=205686 RepID=A0A8H7J8B4_9PLEO|nr:hypothetical protein EKO04_002673 [Ascochyta lentis]